MNEQTWIVVPAAGIGERMGSAKPKQYLALGNHSILETTLNRLLDVPEVAGVVVVLSEYDAYWADLPTAAHPRIHVTQGGRMRTDSVVAGLEYVLEQTQRDAWVLVHDAARPLIQLSDIQRLRDAVYNSGATGGILGTPVQDTLKQADEYYCIERTVSRESLWQAQTPQMFRAGELHDAIQAVLQNEEADVVLTDEASAMECQSYEPLLVEALHPNLKITRPADLSIVRALLAVGTQPV